MLGVQVLIRAVYFDLQYVEFNFLETSFGHQNFLVISGGNDLDEQVKLQQAMLRRQELLDKIRVSQCTDFTEMQIKLQTSFKLL